MDTLTCEREDLPDGALCLSLGTKGMETDLAFCMGGFPGDPLFAEQAALLDRLVFAATHAWVKTVDQEPPTAGVYTIWTWHNEELYADFVPGPPHADAPARTYLGSWTLAGIGGQGYPLALPVFWKAD